MNNQTIIKQLEKALECKELKEMKMRVEVLLDILKESVVRTPMSQPMQQPAPQPVQPVQPKLAGSGAIVSNGEEIRPVRPAGT